MYTIYFSPFTTYPLSPPGSTSYPPDPSQLHVLLFFFPEHTSNFNHYCTYLDGCGATHWSIGHQPGTHPKENWLFPSSHQLSKEPQLGWGSWAPSSSMLIIFLYRKFLLQEAARTSNLHFDLPDASFILVPQNFRISQENQSGLHFLF